MCLKRHCLLITLLPLLLGVVAGLAAFLVMFLVYPTTFFSDWGEGVLPVDQAIRPFLNQRVVDPLRDYTFYEVKEKLALAYACRGDSDYVFLYDLYACDSREFLDASGLLRPALLDAPRSLTVTLEEEDDYEPGFMIPHTMNATGIYAPPQADNDGFLTLSTRTKGADVRVCLETRRSTWLDPNSHGDRSYLWDSELPVGSSLQIPLKASGRAQVSVRSRNEDPVMQLEGIPVYRAEEAAQRGSCQLLRELRVTCEADESSHSFKTVHLPPGVWGRYDKDVVFILKSKNTASAYSDDARLRLALIHNGGADMYLMIYVTVGIFGGVWVVALALALVAYCCCCKKRAAGVKGGAKQSRASSKPAAGRGDDTEHLLSSGAGADGPARGKANPSAIPPPKVPAYVSPKVPAYPGDPTIPDYSKIPYPPPSAISGGVSTITPPGPPAPDFGAPQAGAPAPGDASAFPLIAPAPIMLQEEDQFQPSGAGAQVPLEEIPPYPPIMDA